MKEKIFEYAIIWHPTEKQSEDGQTSKLIGGVKHVMAKDERSATLMAAREIPAEYVKDSKLDQIEVALRPF